MSDTHDTKEADMISSREAADILGVSVATFHRRIKDGTLPLPWPETNSLIKRPRKVRFLRADVERLATPRAPSPEGREEERG